MTANGKPENNQDYFLTWGVECLIRHKTMNICACPETTEMSLFFFFFCPYCSPVKASRFFFSLCSHSETRGSEPCWCSLRGSLESLSLREEGAEIPVLHGASQVQTRQRLFHANALLQSPMFLICTQLWPHLLTEGTDSDECSCLSHPGLVATQSRAQP